MQITELVAKALSRQSSGVSLNASVAALASRSQNPQEHTGTSLKGLETISLDARVDQVNIRYSELAANMADVAGKLTDGINQCEMPRAGPAPAPPTEPIQQGLPTAGSPTVRGSETQGAHLQPPANFTRSGAPIFFGPEAAAQAAQQQR